MKRKYLPRRLLCLTIWILCSCNRMQCGETVIQDFIKGDNKIVILKKDCGATTSVATHVLLENKNAGLKEVLFVAEGMKPPKVIWENEREVKIIHQYKQNEIFKQTNPMGNVSIVYSSEG